jgi:hypothetical protein
MFQLALSQLIALPIMQKQFRQRTKWFLSGDVRRKNLFRSHVYQTKVWTGLATMLTMVLKGHNNNAHLDQPGLPGGMRVSIHVCTSPAPERRVSFCQV